MEALINTLLSFVVPFAILIFLGVSSIRVLREYDRGVVFMLGRLWRVEVGVPGMPLFRGAIRPAAG